MIEKINIVLLDALRRKHRMKMGTLKPFQCFTPIYLLFIFRKEDIGRKFDIV